MYIYIDIYIYIYCMLSAYTIWSYTILDYISPPHLRHIFSGFKELFYFLGEQLKPKDSPINFRPFARIGDIFYQN